MTHPQRAQRLRAVGTITAIGACAVAQWYIRAGQYRTVQTVVLLVAALVAAILAGPPVERVEVTTPGGAADRQRRFLALGILVAVVGAGGFALAIYWLRTDWYARFTEAAPLTVVAVGVWSIGLAIVQRCWWRPPVRTTLPWWEVVTVGFIFAVAVFLRFHRYDYYPPDGVCAVEEPQAGQIAFEIFAHGARPWEFLADRWLPVPFFALFGVSLTTLRLPFTMISALTVPAVYLVLRQVVARPPALLATALFAVCSWHLLYARLGHNIFATTLLVVVLYAICLRVHRRPGLAWYPWIGFLSAYTLYTYAGYRGTTLFVGLFFLISLWVRVREWRRAILPRAVTAARQTLVVELVGLVLAAAAYAGPVVVLVEQLRKHPAYYLEAANRSLLNEQYYTADVRAFLRQRIDRIVDTAAIFNHTGDSSATFNLPNEPMLDPVTGTLLPIALAYCLVWWRYRWQGYFALTFLVLLLLGSTFVQNLDVRRLQGIVPLIFVLAGFFLDRLWSLAHGAIGRGAQRWLVGSAAMLAGVVGWLNYDLFFNRTITDPAVRQGFQNRYTVLLRYVRTLPRDAYVMLVGDTYNFYSASDFSWLLAGTPPGEVTGDLWAVFRGDPGPWTGRDLRVVVESTYEHDDLARLIAARFPGVRCNKVVHPDTAGWAFVACDLGRRLRAPAGQTRGVRARYFRGDDPSPFIDRIEPAISFGFQPAACRFPQGSGKPPCRVEWEGVMSVDEPGKYYIVAEASEGAATLTIDGNSVHGDVEMSAGTHQVRMTARYGSSEDPGARLRWRNPRTGEIDLLPLSPPP